MSQAHQTSNVAEQHGGDPVALLVPQRSGLRVSRRGFWNLCRANDDLQLERTARGELIVMTPAGTESGGRNARLTQRLGNWADADGTGRFFDSSTGFALPNGATRSPDASWVSFERWKQIPPDERERFAPVCPDFVVEVLSPSDERTDVRKKMEEYINQGAQLGWLIDPSKREVEIYRPGHAFQTLNCPLKLSGENVLPGFELDLKGVLFD